MTMDSLVFLSRHIRRHFFRHHRRHLQALSSAVGYKKWAWSSEACMTARLNHAIQSKVSQKMST